MGTKIPAEYAHCVPSDEAPGWFFALEPICRGGVIRKGSTGQIVLQKQHSEPASWLKIIILPIPEERNLFFLCLGNEANRGPGAVNSQHRALCATFQSPGLPKPTASSSTAKDRALSTTTRLAGPARPPVAWRPLTVGKTTGAVARRKRGQNVEKAHGGTRCTATSRRPHACRPRPAGGLY